MRVSRDAVAGARRKEPIAGRGPSTSSFAVHVFALCGFAIAQPIYDWVSRQPEFLVAHGFDLLRAIVLVVLLSGFVPAVIAAGILCFRVFGWSTLHTMQALAIGLLGGLLALQSLSSAAPWLAFLLAGTAAAAVAIAYAKLTTVRSILAVSALGAVLFPVIFLATDPVRSMAFGHGSVGYAFADESQQPHDEVVLIVLDELPLAALLERERTIDAERFPNFARLAETSTWYPNTTGVHISTTLTLPALVTGKMPDPDRKQPRWQTHSHNVFTWAASVYGRAVVGVEAVTELCPPSLCGNESTDRGTALARLGLDVSVLLGYVLLPEKLARARLPEIHNRWHNLVDLGPEAPETPGLMDRFWTHIRSDRAHVWREFVRDMEPGFNFLHILLPHGPHMYLADGTRYHGPVQGMDTTGTIWQAVSLSRVEYQRYLIQLQFTDRLLGELIDRLQETGRWDSTLLVVTADHGKSFRLQTHKRHVMSESLQDVLNVPLFIKEPGQSQGRVDNYRATILDIVPTMTDILGHELPWQTDGQSLVAEKRPDRHAVRVSCLGNACSEPITARARNHQVLLDPEEIEATDTLAWKRNTITWSTRLGLFVPQSRHTDLLGHRIEEFALSRDAQAEVEIYESDSFKHVRPDSDIPALIRGRIHGSVLPTEVTLAVALNHRVVGLASPVNWNDTPGYFATLVPASAFTAGRNELAVYTVEQSASNKTMLTPIRLGLHDPHNGP